ncbi:MAG: (d)CMP kinase [Holosporaceae bacterium]|jgi:cytidylate kinase|nr:(d)CMP kinase [Holosporaceae bacterium]
MKPVIAIDGHGCSGKGTMARLLAQHFCFAHLDSGSFYRLFACLKLAMAGDFFNSTYPDSGISKIEDISNCLNLFGQCQWDDKSCDKNNFLIELLEEISVHDLLQAKETIPTGVLRSDIVGIEASIIAKIPEVRSILTKLIREFATSVGDEYKGSVVDGRDIGTVVFPDANCKIFMTADQEIRAQRRLNDMPAGTTLKEVYDNLLERDDRDFSRKVAPLTFDSSYVLVDTTRETVEESFARLVDIVNNSIAPSYSQVSR